MYAYMRGGQRLALGVFLNCLSLCVLRQSLSLDLELTASARLANQIARGLRLPLPLQASVADKCVLLHLPASWVLGIQTRIFHTFMTSTLPTELFSQPQDISFLLHPQPIL